MGISQILLIILFSFALNLPVYGLANRNIASNANRNTKNAFWLGIIGPLGMVICLFKSVKPNWKKVLFGIGRFMLWAIGVQVLGELNIITEAFRPILLYFIGLPLILRGQNIFNYSVVKKRLEV